MNELQAVPDGWNYEEVLRFLYMEARLADASDYDGWEALWTDDAIYWVPAGGADIDPYAKVSVVFDNRSRIRTRMNQLRTGRRYAQAPPSDLRRIIGNVELMGGRASDSGEVDLEVEGNFLVFESRSRKNTVWGGRATYRLRRTTDGIRLAYKKAVLVDSEKPIPTMSFLI